MNIFWKLLLLLALILVNAFFAMSEIAIITLNDNKIRKMAEDGHKKAMQVVKLTGNPARFLATTQLWVTLAGFLASAVAADSLSKPLAVWIVSLSPSLAGHQTLFQTLSLIVITLIVSYFTLVLGELVPKRIAMQKPEPIAFAVVRVIHFSAAVSRPFVTFLSASGNAVLRLFGVDPHGGEEQVTEEEIRMMVDVGEEKGVIEESQKEMINNIFEFDERTAGEVMTPRTDVWALEINEPISEALKIGVEEGVSRIPVYEEDIDHVAGVLYVKDMLPYVGKLLPKNLTLKDFVRPTYFVPSTKRCDDLFEEMTEKRLHFAVVVDEYGGMAGIVTMEDLLESIVGNMQDEFDHEEEEITRLDENSFDIAGDLDIGELNELLGIELPEGDYDTVAGFILDQLGRIPEPGEQPEVKFENITFTVTEMDERRIDTVHVETVDDERLTIDD